MTSHGHGGHGDDGQGDGGEVLRTPDGLRFQVLKGTPEGEEAEVLGAAIDRLATWDQSHQTSTWVTAGRPGIGRRAWRPGTRWGHSLRSDWGQER